ncbi:putative ribonuclease H-like domain-containing protein, partial [Tanacetum coccineum]
MWDAIKSRFGRNDESKKMQKYILKQQFEGFSVSNSEGLHKGYDRTKPRVDSLSFNDLYNNLRVFKNDVKGSTTSSYSTQNVAFISENTSSTNDVSTAYGVSNPSGQNSQYEHASSYSLLANQSSCPQLDHEDLEQLDEFDLEEMDLKWQVAMISTKRQTGHFARECRTKGNQDNRRRDAWNSGNKDGRRSGKQEDSKALVTIDGEGVDWTSHSEEEEDYALMACNSLDIEEKIRFMKIDLDDKTDVLTYRKKLLAEAQKEKEDLKAKVEKWHNSSKNLGKLLNTQMSANDKFGLGYGDHRYDGILSYENEVLQSVFMNKESELEKQPLYDRFVTAGGMHVVPPPMTGNYMPSGPDVEIDYSQFTYGPKQSQPSESKTQTSDFDTCESESSEPIVNEPKVVSQPKVWYDDPIIEEYASDSEDEHVSLPTEEQETPSFANQQVKTPRETVKNQFTNSKNPKVDKKGLGYGFVTKSCFVCGSLSHLIRDCDFHEKRMAKQAELNNRLRKKSSQRDIRPIWNNVQRVNHQNQFVPTAVLTRIGKIPVSTARASGTNNVSTASHLKEEEDYALMACNSSDTKVTSCSKECKESYAKLKKLYDEQRAQLSDASIEIQAYTQGLKKIKAQLVVHQRGQLWYEEKIRFIKIDLDDKTDVLTYHKKLLAEAQKEKKDLKAKVEKWHNSSKNLGKLLNTQMSANDKFGLGYGDHRYDGILSYENEVLQSVFMNKESELVNQPLYDRFVTAGGMHAVPPPMTGNYMPSGPDVEIDYSLFKYGPKQSQPSESETQTSDFDTYSEDEHVSLPTKEQETPSFANQQVKTPRETVKNQFTNSKNPKVDKKGLGYGFVTKACFVCGSLSHLIRDCDFHEKRMAKQAELNNKYAVPTNAAMKVNNVKPIVNRDYPHRALKNKGIVDSGCSRHMTGNKAYLAEFQDFNGGPVAFGGSKGYITGKGKIKTGKLDFEDVCFVKELQHFNLFSVSQICDKKHKVLFTDSECLVLSPEFKLPDANQVLLKIPRQNNMYSFNLENIVPSGGLACLIAKATTDESNKWHRRLGHVNFKNLNKLVKGNLVRGLPSKIFQNDHTCVACQKGKQHKASCKAKSVSSISHSLQLLHMDLFGPTSVRSLNHKTYCLVITDDFSRFSWVFFLRTKDETSGILKDFIRQIENQLNQKVKTIRCDNGTEFKNKDVIEFCGSKGIKREYSNARTPQQNGVAERKNRTLIEAARTMLADSFLPNTFWAEAVSTACYVLNRVLVTKPHNKTPYELLTGTVKPIVNRVRPANVFHKTHSPSSRPFKKTTVLRTNFSKQKVNTAKVNAVSTVGGKRETAVKPSAGCNWRPQRYNWHNDYPHRALKNKGIVDSGCSRHMTGNKAYLAEFQDFNGGPVAFGGSKGYITGKGKIKTGKLDFEDVCFVKELQHFNLFSVSQMCDKKNKVLFTDSECLVLSPEFKLPDENQVLLKIPRQNNMYSFNLENIVPSGGLACLIAKATIDESNKWHRRLGHVNFKNLNKLVKGNLVRGLPSKIFQNDHTCVACQKGKQHKASCKAKSVSSISHSLQLLHMDLFGPTSVRSLNHKTYCLVITDDFSRFSWVFFLRTKDETSGILIDFIRQIENQLNQKVKTIRSDNATEFKNKDVIEFCGSKG